MNKPFNKEQIKKLEKGLTLTREIIHVDKETLEVRTYPNRRERRNMLFQRNNPRINNRKNYSLTTLQKVPVFVNEKNEIITKKMKAGKDYIDIIFAGFKNIFHIKPFKNWVKYQPVNV